MKLSGLFIIKVVEIKKYWSIMPVTEGNIKDLDGLEPLFMTSIFFALDVSLSVDSNDSLFTIFSDILKKCYVFQKMKVCMYHVVLYCIL